MMFSVIMPFYNVEEYLAEAIESVLHQTYTDFELILVNDGSTDTSEAIANSYLAKDTRVQLVSQKNQGLSAARNTGLQSAKGEYIYFIDSDDWILDNTLNLIYEKLKIKKYDIVCFTAQSFITSKTNLEDKKNIQRSDEHYERAYLEEKEYSSKAYQDLMNRKSNFVPSACLYIFKNSLVKEHKLTFYEGIIFEDNLFTRELLAYAENLYFIPKKLYQRRIRQGSITSSKVDERKPYAFLVVAEELFNLAIVKQNDKQLLTDAAYFFHEALMLIKNEFKDSKELKLKLFSVYRKLKIKKYKYLIFELKYPYLKPLFFLAIKVRLKLARVFT